MSNTPEKAARSSADIESESLQKLREVFPQFVKDGEIDFDALKVFLAEEGLLASEEKYGLSWAGKSDAFRAIRTPASGTLAPQKEESKNWEETGNLFLEGDNLEILKLLQKQYREEVKMIYIDPPYNTGGDFIYKDNFHESKSDYYERTGQTSGGVKLTSNTESGGRYHSDWLTMMYPRLFLAKNLLKKDGVIFISIDDNEVHNLRHIMDEIFGEENFVATFVWNQKTGRQNDAKFASKNHEYVLCYAKYVGNLEFNLLPRSELLQNEFQNPDNDPRGEWIHRPLHAKSGREADIYEVTFQNGVTWRPPQGTFPRFSKNKLLEMYEDDRLWFGSRGKNVPRYKRFLFEVKQGVITNTLLTANEVGSTQKAKEDYRSLGIDVNFDNPKPVALLRYVIKLGASKNSTVLDFFAGSATTAHAVMQQNAEDGGNRKWICVQIPEEVEEGSEAAKVGYKTIAEIARERIRRAGDKIKENYAEQLEERETALDSGLKSFGLQESNYREWHELTEDDDEEKLKEQMKLFAEKPLVDDYNEESVVYEILLKEGFNLNSNVEQQKLGDLNVWTVADNDYRLVASFAKELTKDQIESLDLTENDTFVCFDYALDDETKVNITRNVNVKVI